MRRYGAGLIAADIDQSLAGSRVLLWCLRRPASPHVFRRPVDNCHPPTSQPALGRVAPRRRSAQDGLVQQLCREKFGEPPFGGEPGQVRQGIAPPRNDPPPPSGPLPAITRNRATFGIGVEKNLVIAVFAQQTCSATAAALSALAWLMNNRHFAKISDKIPRT